MTWVAITAFIVVGATFMYIVYEIDKHKTKDNGERTMGSGDNQQPFLSYSFAFYGNKNCIYFYWFFTLKELKLQTPGQSATSNFFLL